MRAGRLSDLVIIEARVLTLTAGQYVETWVAEERKIPCDPERLSETAARFTIRYRSDVTTKSHRLIWDGAYWSFTNVIHDRKRTMMMIEADISDLIEVTHLQSTQREFDTELPIIRPESE